jgi:hypothetical protein
LSTKLVRLTIRVRGPWAPQVVQVAGAGSLTFWSTSWIFPQLGQAYS